MTNNKSGIPKLRFPGYTEPWEQRKLGEVADIVGGGTPSTNNDEYWNGDIDWYSPVEINNQIYVSGSKNKITELGLQKSSAKVLPIGTVLFTSRAGIGKTAILAKKGTTNQGFQSILPHENKLDSYFIFSRTDELKRYGETNGAGSTFVEVSGKQMSKMPIMLPKIEEQMRIGTFFQQLDHLITLHQRKLDDLKTQKKGLLQKMFPKNGEDVPEVRFPGFTGAWEQRKFSELYKKNLERNKDQFSSDRTISIATMRFKEEGNGAAENSLVSYKVLREGDIAFEGHTSKQFAFGRFVLNDIGDGIMSPRFTTLRPTQDMPIKFWKQYIHYEPIMRYPIVNSTKLGTMMNELVVDEFLNQPVLVPELSEQQKIGSFFNQLDGTINLHQRKLEHLKLQKKGLLQQMFV